jgi:(S)-ureidoglycine aminohydrolase
MESTMPELFGHTRARVAARHALLTPANHVASALPGVTGATSIVLINEAMGAGFAQLQVTFQEGGSIDWPASDVETFAYVMQGSLVASVGKRARRLGRGGYLFAPAEQPLAVSAPQEGTQVTLFQKIYHPLDGVAAPRPRFGNAGKVQGTPFLGDPAADLKVLLPDEPSFDLAVNLFTYQPGGHLPFVEVHVMEHGLLMLAGAGVYRLEDDWYPVQAGDVIWMGPYCPQWFVAMGKTPASYLYYKDVNRPAI